MTNRATPDPEYFLIGRKKVLFIGNETGSTGNKFNRVAMIAKRYTDLNLELMEKVQYEIPPTSKEYNLAVAMLFIMRTGIRIGNEDSAEGFMSTYKEKGKEVLAHTYGLTTLLPQHVKVIQGRVHFDFTGKKHVENTFVLDAEMSALVLPILRSGYSPIFNITEPELTKFIKQISSPYLSSKDFRTFRANVFAYEFAKNLRMPTTKKMWKEQAKKVYEAVSEQLNNTPGVVKTSYLDPRLLEHMWGHPDEIETKQLGGKIWNLYSRY